LKNKHIKISDIDFSKDINNKTRDFEKQSNIYFSPELIKRNFITPKTDIWYFFIIALILNSIFVLIILILSRSTGVVLYELIELRTLFKNCNEILNCNENFKYPGIKNEKFNNFKPLLDL
jgi:hypothetical protein